MARGMTREEEVEQWSDDVLSQGSVESYMTMYENGVWYWCFFLDSGVQRYWKDLPEHIQRKLGVKETDIVHDDQLHPRCYWRKKHDREKGTPC